MVLNTSDLTDLLGGEVTDVERLLGGASRETWAIRLDGRPLVVRRDPVGSPRAGVMRREAALLRAAAAAGVPVPEVVAVRDDVVVVERLYGETLARRILRDDEFAVARTRLVAQCAAALARLHRGVAVPSDLPFDAEPLNTLRAMLDSFGEPHPALELGLRRLAESRPERQAVGACVVHGDFRLGNLMVDADGLVGVLDWELAHVGDPAEDLGWMCVRSWRFGSRLPVAGVGDRDELLAAYAEAGGEKIDPATLNWWELYGTVRWGVICIQQAAAHLTGAVRSVELAAIGRRTAEVELDVLELIEPDLVAELVAQELPQPEPDQGPHDRPTSVELLDAVDEWLGTLDLAGHDAFLRRVASRVLATVKREIALGPLLAARHRDRMPALEDAAVVRAIAETVVDKVRIADPAQLRR